MKKFICMIIFTCVIVVSLGSVSVEKKVKQTEGSNYENSIVYNIDKFPRNLIMTDSYNVRQKDLLSNIFSGLVSIDENGNIIPDIAEKWSVNKDKTQYTFTIRKDARWSNGKSITSDDFQEFFSKILSANTRNIYEDQLKCIFGVEDYRKGTKGFEDVAIKALNKRTLQIRLNYPCEYFLNIMAQPIYSLRKIDNNLSTWKKKYKEIPYSGSFVIDKIFENGDIQIKKNKNYWNSKKVKNTKITMTALDSGESALAAFENNNVSVFTNPPISELKNIKNAVVVPTYGEQALIFNMKKQRAISSAYFRKAVALSVDRKNISQNLLGNRVDPASVYIPYSRQITYKELVPDNQMAKESLKKADYEYDDVNFKIIYVNTVENKRICDSIADNIKNTLNIDAKAYGYTKDEFAKKIKGNDYDMAEVDFRGNYYYPIELLQNFETDSKLNFGGYNSREFDAKILQATFENDDAKRLKELYEAQDMLLDSSVVIPLYFDNTIICTKNYVKGVYMNKLGNIKFDRAYLSR